MKNLSVLKELSTIHILEINEQITLKGGKKGQGCAPDSFDDDDWGFDSDDDDDD